jgi:LPXTG-motif cell wall-anchored protein
MENANFFDTETYLLLGLTLALLIGFLVLRKQGSRNRK